MNEHINFIRSKCGRALFFLREYFFPAGCARCGAGLVTVNETWYGLCEPCRAEIEAGLTEGGGARCDCCGRPLVSEQGRCLPCRGREAPAFDRVRVLFPYAGTYRRLLSAYKFGRHLALGNFFAEKIRQAAEQFTETVPAAENPRQRIRNTVPLAIGIPESGPDRALYDLYLRRAEGWKEKVLEWARLKLPRSIETPDGRVFFSKNALKNAFGHRIGPLKILSVPYLPEILQKGVMFYSNDDGKFTYYNYAHRVTFEARDHIAVGIVREDRNGKRFYDNEFFEGEKLMGEPGPPAVPAGNPADELAHPSMKTILQNILFVNNNFAPETAIVPVPPRPGKIKKSGWDQVEYLARLLERERGSAGPVLRRLKRLPSKVQKRLGREERGTNLRGRIVLTGAAPKTAILVDDVMTTGSTMDACASVLKAGGAERVYGICLFYD